MAEMWAQVGSAMASLMFVYAIVQKYFPYQLRHSFERYTYKLLALFHPYIHITFHEYTGDHFRRDEVYDAIRTYLGVTTSARARHLRAAGNDVKGNKSLVLGLDDNVEVLDEFRGGVKLWWISNSRRPQSSVISLYPNSDEKRFYTLKFHHSHRELVTSAYLGHVVAEAKRIEARNRQRKLYTNGTTENRSREKSTKWNQVLFEHPASFETLAMDPKKKKEIIDDLTRFKTGQEYYKKIGKAWKRGYLLHGPPGTGKSTMICAMANFLDYDVYDLELTAVKDNTELKKLLIDTSDRSIIVIEDIDCSLDLTGRRNKTEREKGKKKIEGDHRGRDDEDDKSKVTLSGLLNFIDGIWSACGGERVIVLTTNHADRLDPALIRRGRMDKHVELSYCRFEAFKVLARNYLGVESHALFAAVERLLAEADMTPADVAEYLMPKSDEEDADACLNNLVEALEKAKVEAEIKKAKEKEEEEDKLEAKEKEEEELSCAKEDGKK